MSMYHENREPRVAVSELCAGNMFVYSSFAFCSRTTRSTAITSPALPRLAPVEESCTMSVSESTHTYIHIMQSLHALTSRRFEELE